MPATGANDDSQVQGRLHNNFLSTPYGVAKNQFAISSRAEYAGSKYESRGIIVCILN